MAGTRTLHDDASNAYEVWVIETPSSRQGRLCKIYVSDQMPYYFGADTRDIIANTVSPWHRFSSVTTLPRMIVE